MRKLLPCLLVVAVGVVMVVAAGCPKKEAPEAVEIGPGATDPGAPPGEETTDAGTEAVGATLTKETVKSFMASMEDETIEEVMDKIGDEMGAGDEADPETIKAAFEAAASNAELDAAVQAHGFADAAEWVATAQKVFPGLAYAMAHVMAEAMGIEEDSEEFKEMMADSEFAELEGAFEKPTDEEQQVIVEAFKEMAEEEQGGAMMPEAPEEAPEAP